jgi:hypothetical protein
MSYFTNFFLALPSAGWGILAGLLLLYFALHLYEGYILSGYHLFSHATSVQRVKKLFKPALLFVAGAMAMVALFSPQVLPKNHVDKLHVNGAELRSIDAEKAAGSPAGAPTDRVPKPRHRNVFKHDLVKGE